MKDEQEIRDELERCREKMDDDSTTDSAYTWLNGNVGALEWVLEYEDVDGGSGDPE